MAISDLSREPALERALPADAAPGPTIPENTEAKVQLNDGTWTWAQVIGQRKDRCGRWCVGLRWYASPSIGGREGWYLYDPQRLRRPNGPLLRLLRRSPGSRAAPLVQAGREVCSALRGSLRALILCLASRHSNVVPGATGLLSSTPSRLGRAAARSPSPGAASFDYRPASDHQRHHTIQPPGAQQGVSGQAEKDGHGQIGA